MRRACPYALLFAFLLAACSRVEVAYDYDLDARFDDYASWAWAPDEPDSASPGRGVNEAISRSGLLDRRIRRTVSEALSAKGLDRSAGEPDLLVMYRVTVRDRTEFTSWGRTYAGDGGRWSGARNVDGYEFKEGTLIVDLVDRRRNRLAWRGVARGEMGEGGAGPAEADERMREVIHRMFRNYPPPD